ncbi:hypothetical protein [Staphylococcus aureus]|uniref:hypothetical protein n=1 Tax=Staphylococcus aureus TaxID=1280 RepID=UPI00091C694D|nr:hypothetical protein [Staphylococcus aureus]QPV65680.1 hypothetical protein I1A60_09405 [Staphylococcus aureus]UVI86664.1 hypothetical protein NW951_08870 [Staphylococcus aureus]UVJ27819.1 hypothetical protein NW963_08855 [Staphylococcus aureus]SGR31168.1 Uncharacterised protein [Staphylococcus aureus]SGT78353.1 Uncharacterised protein [Staphylococcus aureus]
MYIKLEFEDATQSLISNDNKVLIKLKDENNNLHFIETDGYSADNLIQHFLIGHHFFIRNVKKDNIKKCHSKTIKLSDLIIYKPVIITDDNHEIEMSNNQITKAHIAHIDTLFTELTDIVRYSEPLDIDEVQTYIKEFDWNSNEVIFLISIIILTYRLIKEIENTFDFVDLIEILSSKTKLINKINKIKNRDDLDKYVNSSFLNENWEKIKDFKESTFIEIKTLFESIKEY